MSKPDTPLDLQVAVDNSHGGQDGVRSSRQNRRRSGHISFDYQTVSGGSGFYWVRAWGDLFPDEGDEYKGKLTRDEHDTFAAISHCRTVWQQAVTELKVPDEHARTRRFRFPFADAWDLSSPADKDQLDKVGRRLARAGRTLFTYLFRQRDEELRRIGELLEAGLRSDEQILAFHSDELFAPWWMLYTPPEPGIDLDHPDAPWSLEGFWGYRHLIEHQFSRVRCPSHVLARGGIVHIGLNVDLRLDEDLPMPFVRPVVAFLKEADHACSCAVREHKAEFAVDIKADDFPDQIIYFGCHGSVSGSQGGSTAQAQLVLSDGEPIHTSELCAWLNERPTGAFSTNPIVFINACQGGQMASHFYGSFGLEFMKHGANCLVGPQIDVPATFAAEYATRLFREFLQPGTRLGDVVRDLARDFATAHHNPLGLVFSLYRGLDTHLVHEPPPPP